MKEYSSKFDLLKSKSSKFTLAGATEHYPVSLELNPLHLIISLDLDLEKHSAEAELKYSFEILNPELKSLTLNAVDLYDLSVESEKSIDWSYDHKTIQISFEDTLKKSEKIDITIKYLIEKPKSGLFFFDSKDKNGETMFFAVSDHETERARHWLPCIDSPASRPSLEFFLTAPERYTSLANGSLISEKSLTPSKKTTHWKLDFPCPSYLTNFAVGDFVKADDGNWNGLPLAYFAAKDRSEDELMKAFGRTGEMLSWITQKLRTDFPFPKYYQYAVPFIGGAMENISLVSWNDIFLLNDELSAEWKRTVDSINLHEMAHSYFGDAIVCRDYSQAWLKESWATYMEQCWTEDKHGEEEQSYHFYQDSRSYFGEADGRYKRPIITRKFNSSWQMYDMHLYPGGACRLHMLRKLIGDEIFWDATCKYVKDFHNKLVETEDFRKTFEDVSGMPLVKFFDQWFYKKGYPSLKISFDYDKKSKTCSLIAEQTQKEKSEFLFDFDLEILIQNGKKNFVEIIKINKEKNYHSFPCSKDPEFIEVDPSNKILMKYDFDPGSEKLEKQLLKAKNPISRIEAAKKFAKNAKERDIELLFKAWKKETFWGLRLEIAKAINSSGTLFAQSKVASIIDKEDNHMVLMGLLRAINPVRSKSIAAAIYKRLEKGSLGPMSKMSALETLGRNCDFSEKYFPALKEEASKEGFNQLSNLGAYKGLALSMREAASEHLLKLVNKDLKPSAKKQSIKSLAALYKFSDEKRKKQIRDSIYDIIKLDDAVINVDAAFPALLSCGAGIDINLIERLSANYSKQDQVDVQAMIEAYHSTSENNNKSEVERLQKLEQKILELEEELRKSASKNLNKAKGK